MTISVNSRAMDIVCELIDKHEELGCAISEYSNGASVIDCGIDVEGSVEAGRLVSEICAGGLASVRISKMHIDDLTLPSVVVSTDEPTLASLASQKAGWHIKAGEYQAMGSGPARASAAVEKKLFAELDYKDDAKESVILLETRDFPPEEATEYIAEKCGISSEDLYCIVAPTASIVGSVQISARIVEVGVYRLHKLGFNPKKIRKGYGTAPIAPVADKDSKAMGVTNDCILYAGRTYFFVRPEEEDDLATLTKKVPSSTSKQYGEPFYKLFKSVDYDFYQIDQDLFSPAEVTITDIETGEIYKAGEMNPEILKQSLALV